MVAKKSKKTKRPKYVWPKRKQNKEMLKIKGKLSNAEVIKRLSLDKDEKKAFNAFKTGKGKWTITLAAQNENSGWQRYLATKNKFTVGWKEGLVNDDRYHVSWNINKKIDPPKRPKPKKTKVKKSKKTVKTEKDPEK
jgi:hypothetical protein